MKLKTRKIRVTFTVSSKTGEEDLRNICEYYKVYEYGVNDESDFELLFYLNTVLEYNEVLIFMKFIHRKLEKHLTLEGIEYKGMRWTPNETYPIGGLEEND